MMRIRTRVRQMFCRHIYEEKQVYGFQVVNGWMVRPTCLVCRMCGKKKY